MTTDLLELLNCSIVSGLPALDLQASSGRLDAVNKYLFSVRNLAHALRFAPRNCGSRCPCQSAHIGLLIGFSHHLEHVSVAALVRVIHLLSEATERGPNQRLRSVVQ